MRVYGIIIAVLIGLSMQAAQGVDADGLGLESSLSSLEGRHLVGSYGSATSSYGSHTAPSPYPRVPCTDAEDCSGNGSASGFRPTPQHPSGCSCQCRGGFDGPRCEKAPVGDKLTCDFGNEWVLPAHKMTDPSMKEEVRAALSRGTKVCFCKDTDTATQPHHTAICRSDHTGAWSAQTALGQDKMDEANCFCMKGTRPTPPPTPAGQSFDVSHGSYGSFETPPPTPAGQSLGASHGSHGSHGSFQRLCLHHYCRDACLPFYYCLDPAKADANCLNAPVDCDQKCGGCTEQDVFAMQRYGSHSNPSLPSSGGGASGSYHSHSGSQRDVHSGYGGSSYAHDGSSYAHDGSSYMHDGSSYMHGGSSYDGRWVMVEGKWKWYSLGNEYAPAFSHEMYGSSYAHGGSSDMHGSSSDGGQWYMYSYNTTTPPAGGSYLYYSHNRTGSAGSNNGSHYGSNYGSNNTNGGSHYARCDYEYCGNVCMQYYHCQFAPSPDCVNAPADCEDRCAGCPPPPQNGGSHHGSNYGSHNTGSAPRNSYNNYNNYGSQQTGSGSHHGGKCAQCYDTRSRPWGVNCYASYDAHINKPSDVVTSGHPLGYKCPGTQYSFTYTCGQAYDGYFGNVSAASHECNEYTQFCCNDQHQGGSNMGSAPHSSYNNYGSQHTGSAPHNSYNNHSSHGTQHTDASLPPRCDYEYCGNVCMQYYHCQFAPSSDCANAPADCADRCAGCPPPPQNGGSHNGSNYGSHNTGSAPRNSYNNYGSQQTGSAPHSSYNNHGSQHTGSAPLSQHNNSYGGKCRQCYDTRSRPWGVHCYASYDANINKPLDMVTGGHPLGYKCPGTQYSFTYTCGQAYDGGIGNVWDSSPECNMYKQFCCNDQHQGGSNTGSAPHNSYNNYGSHNTDGGSHYGSHLGSN